MLSDVLKCPGRLRSPLTHTKTRIQDSSEMRKSGPCCVFHSVPCHLFLSAGLFRVLTELNGHRSQVLWMLFIRFPDENGLALFSIVLHPQRFRVVFVVQTDFNLHLWFIFCLQVASSPGITSPFLGHQCYPFHVCLVRKTWFSVSKAPVPSPPSLTPHCSLWVAGKAASGFILSSSHTHSIPSDRKK